jgi:ribosome-associated protein
MTTDQRLNIITEALDDLKANDIQSLDVRHLTDMMDNIVVCTASSTTHAKSLARNLELELKAKKITILGIEGDNKSDWVLVDIGDVVAHIMLAETRELYALEKLWDISRKDINTETI